ncbi:MAG: methyltransferase [Microcella sp.]|nr:methyltransferase [Microcella sp.]
MDAALVTLLRADLLAAGYSVDRLRQLWGDEAEAALARGDRVPARRALDSAGPPAASPAAILARLFVLSDPVGDAQLDVALPRLAATGARSLGLIDDAGRALLDLRPYSAIDGSGAVDWFVVSDLDEFALQSALPPDHVLGVGGASVTLAALIPTDPVESVLDLGTGCGIQSLHAVRQADRVIATDISPRALERARLTLALNAVEKVELRQGDLFAPVVGERFDRIVSNPPFVITPRRDGVPLYEYRDGGLVGDAIVERVVRGAAEHLVPGGTAHVLGNWEYRDEQGGDGLARVRRWIDDAGLDGWVVERERQSPAEYAATWIRDGGTRVGTPEYERQAGDWLDDFAQRGVTAIGFGYLLLRRPASGTARLLRTEVLTSPLGAPTGIGDHVLACLRAHDLVATIDDAALGELRLELAPDVTEERHYWPGEENPTVIRLRQGGGFARTIETDAALAGLVGASDGELTVTEIVGALADLLEVDEGALRDQLLPQVRELIATGLLLVGPVNPATGSLDAG